MNPQAQQCQPGSILTISPAPRWQT